MDAKQYSHQLYKESTIHHERASILRDFTDKLNQAAEYTKRAAESAEHDAFLARKMAYEMQFSSSDIGSLSSVKHASGLHEREAKAVASLTNFKKCIEQIEDAFIQQSDDAHTYSQLSQRRARRSSTSQNHNGFRPINSHHKSLSDQSTAVNSDLSFTESTGDDWAYANHAGNKGRRVTRNDVHSAVSHLFPAETTSVEGTTRPETEHPTPDGYYPLAWMNAEVDVPWKALGLGASMVHEPVPYGFPTMKQ